MCQISERGVCPVACAGILLAGICEALADYWQQILILQSGLYHRNDSACAIHQEIRKTKMNFGTAFSIRWSDVPDVPDSASHESIATPDAITCPEQTEKTKSCATCGLCWGAAEK